MDSSSLSEVLEFISLVTKLKHSPRMGWEYCNIKKCESIASHMYAMGMMTFLLGEDSELDRLKCLQLALVHDLAECIVGDITPRDNIPESTKHKMEDEAMKKISGLVGEKIGQLIYSLYKEYEEKQTLEAKFVKDLDRFDMIFTAATYEDRDQEPGKLQEFFDSTEGKFEHPLVKKLVNALLHHREEIAKNSSTTVNGSDDQKT